MRCRDLTVPNAAAAPATVGGKFVVRKPLGWFPGKAAASGGSASQETCRQRLNPVCRAGCPDRTEAARGGKNASIPWLPLALAPRGWFQVPDESQIQQSRPQLHICVSCWRGGVAKSADAAKTDGRRLYDEVKSLIEVRGAEAPVRLLPILCFANCERGCSAGISAAGKWSYLMGHLGPEHAADLLSYAETYAKAKTGVVLPSKRPPSLEKTVIARFPASLGELKDAAE